MGVIEEKSVNHMQTEPTFTCAKRFQWIDNARIIAALLILCMHLPPFLYLDKPLDSSGVIQIVNNSVYSGRIPFFLILAGYFLARHITWQKAWNRFLWLFIPFTLWNTVIYLLYKNCAGPFHEHADILGIGSVFVPEWALRASGLSVPILTPTWFLRDIMLLSLLPPLIYRFRLWALPVLAIALYAFDLKTQPDPFVTLSVSACLFYTLGVCLSGIQAEKAYALFTPRFTPILILGALLGIGIGVKNALYSGDSLFTREWVAGPFAQLFGAMMIAHCGMLIEKLLPRLSALCAVCAPACFLVFGLHHPLYTLHMPYLPDAVISSYCAMLLPLPVFCLIIGFFLLMKKFTPRLLPWLAHVR